MLRSVLNQHPLVNCADEIMNEFSEGSYFQSALPLKEFIYDKAWASSEGKSTSGFLCHLYHPLPSLKSLRDKTKNWKLYREFWEYIRADDTLRIIYLSRRNVLKRYVSNKLADEHGQWQVYTSQPEFHPHQTLVVDASDFLDHYSLFRRLEHDQIDLLRDKPILRLDYEELAINPQSVCDRLTAFLNIPPMTPTVITQRLERRPLREIIENYEELQTVLAQSGLQDFMTD